MKLLPWKIRDYIEFYKIYQRFPNIKCTQSMNEKVLYRKRHYCNNEVYTMLADKLLVRDYVAHKIGKHYLVPLIDCLNSIDEVIANISQYYGKVIKPNHGSRMVYMTPSRREDVDVNELKKSMQRWMKTDYSSRHGELQYKSINRKILVEAFIGDINKLPIDYKIHTFRNRNKSYSCIIEVIENRMDTQKKSTFFIENISKPYLGEFKFSNHQKPIIKEAIERSKILLGDIEYARIDWYIIDNKLYFGEITLTPGAGLDKDIKGELDDIMGSKWDLSLAPDLTNSTKP